MITITTLISIMLIFGCYVFITFFAIPKMRKILKIMLYLLVFVGLLFPEFKGIGSLNINIGTYAIVLAGIEVFEMIFKYVVEEKKSNGKTISKRIQIIYENM